MRNLRRAVTGVLVVLTIALSAGGPGAEPRLDGFNVIMSPRHPFGGASASRSLELAKKAGAGAVAIVPFLWQSAPDSAEIVRGIDMSDDEIRQAIRNARKLGLAVMIKPHVWINGSWAGAAAPATESDWATWFARYTKALLHIARVAAEQDAEVLCIGTELARTTARPEWSDVIARVRAIYHGALTYAAHNVEEAETVPFWDRLDFIAVTLYPPLGADGDRNHRRSVMRATALRLDAIATRAGKRIVVAEIGIRSAQGAAAKPWESPEEREAAVDLQLQREVLADWLRALARPSVRGILIWRWFTDPDAGGPADTDFTVQGKPAEDVLRCATAAACLP